LGTLKSATSVINEPVCIVQLLEPTLRTYLSQNAESVSDPLGSAVSAFRQGSFTHEILLATAQSLHTPLTLRLLLQINLNRFSNLQSSEWRKNVFYLLPICISIIPPVYHQFDLLALWFWIFDIVADERWIHDKLAEEKLVIVYKHLQHYSGSSSLTDLLSTKLKIGNTNVGENSDPLTQLAARACKLYLDRLIVQKSKEKKDDLSEQLEKLLKSQASYSNSLNGFFKEAESFLSPLVDLTTFKNVLVKQLFPIAPHLYGLSRTTNFLEK